jgi:hypothetical protein
LGAFPFTPKLSLELARRHNTISFDENVTQGQYLCETQSRNEDFDSATVRGSAH